MKEFSIHDFNFYLSALNDELERKKDKIDESSYKVISSFFVNSQELLDKINDADYWEKGWGGYQAFEDSLSKLSRKEIKIINQMLLELKYSFSFSKQNIQSEFKELLKKKRKGLLRKERKEFSKGESNNANSSKQNLQSEFTELLRKESNNANSSKQNLQSEFTELLRKERKELSKGESHSTSFNSSWKKNNSSDLLDFDDDFGQDGRNVRKEESRRRGRTNGGIGISLDLSRLIPKRYNDNITFDDLRSLFERPNAEGREKLVSLYAVIDKFREGVGDSKLEQQFINLLNELSRSDKEYLESKLEKRFDKQVIIDGMYNYLYNKDISYDETESFDINEDPFGKSDMDGFEQEDAWGKSNDGFEFSRKKKKNRRHRTRGGRSKKTLLEGFRKNVFSRSIDLDDVYYNGKITGNEKLSKLYDLVSQVRIGNAAVFDDYDFEVVINSLDFSDIQLMEETYGAKFDGKKLINDFYDLIKVEDKFVNSNDQENSSKDNDKRMPGVVVLDYPTIIHFIELKTGVSILTPYLECLNKLFKESFSIEKYIEKSNLLISEILSRLSFDNKELSNLIQEHFYLNFDINKESSEIINELIGDELRYYQQSYLPKNFHIGDLGSSKIIKKGIIEEDGKLPVFYSEIRSVGDSSYRFNTVLFNNCNFSIYAHDKEEIPKNKVDYMIKHKLFFGDLSGLEIYPSVNGVYNVYNVNTNENDFTL